jgi:imidazolonepropionase-like amidohydrolase
MIRYSFLTGILFFLSQSIVFAQETIYPAAVQKEDILITNGTIHIGNGTVLSNGNILIKNGKIVSVSSSIIPASGSKVIDAKDKHVYPGLILSHSQLGLVEVNSVRATIDHTELGSINPSIRSVVAYNTDSKVINTLKYNGILMANIVPMGGLISGSSSVVQLDAWNWEDALYHADGAMHFYMPSLVARPNPFAIFSGVDSKPASDAVKLSLERIEEVKQFFRDAKAYLSDTKSKAINLKLEACRSLFEGKQKLFVHCDLAKEILVAIDFVKEFGFKVVIVGGSEAWQIADLIKKENLSVILSQQHSLPTSPDDDVDQPYKTASILHKAGVLIAINDEDGQTRGRNLPFNAGTAAAYGMGKEAALQAITLNAARILGIDQRTGSIEVGKDANIVISEGDILDMRSSILRHAFIQGREVSLENKHTQLYDRYKKKYGIK